MSQQGTLRNQVCSPTPLDGEQLEHSITSARQNAYVTSPDALPEQGAPRPDAVVFDTNVWSSGRFNADTFKARATRLGNE